MRPRRPRPILFALVATAALLAVVAFVPHAGAQSTDQQGVQIRRIDTQFYPTVSITVSVPQTITTLTSADVQVAQNDLPVLGVEARPWISTQNGIDVVLAIDTSGSMIGPPLASAIEAAKKFVDESPKQVRIGVLTFAQTVQIIQPITSNHAAARRKLESLVATGETSLYDGVIGAAQMFSGSSPHNIVLLSDGGDTVSKRTLAAAVAAAKQQDASIFAVGLKTKDTDVNALRALASGTNGQYSPAGQADLSNVYSNLAGQISHQYLISYQSKIPGDTQVRISVTIAGTTDTALITTPKLTAPPSPVAPKPLPVQPVPKPFIRGIWGMGIVLVLTFISAMVAISLLMEPIAQARRERELAKRMSVGGGAAEGPVQEEGGFLSQWAPSLVTAGGKLIDLTGFTDRLAQRLEQAGLPLTPGEFVAGSGIAAVLGAVIGGLFLQSFIFAVLLGFVGSGLPAIVLAIATDRRLKRLHEQLPDVLMILASSLRAGHSFMQALDTVAQEIGDPGAREFSRVIAEIRLGRDVDEAMNAMAERIGSSDFKWAVMAVNIQRQVGGNLAEVLDTVADTVRERAQIRRQIDVLSQEGKWSMWILIGLPILIGLYILKVNPEYMKLLFTNTVGLVMLSLMGVLLVVGVIWMRKIIKIDV
jgi:tight adherence protein B